MSSFNFFSLGGFLLRKKNEKCIAFLVPSLHCKLALFMVPYALRATFIPSLRFGTGCASPYNPCHCLKLKNSKLNLREKIAKTRGYCKQNLQNSQKNHVNDSSTQNA